MILKKTFFVIALFLSACTEKTPNETNNSSADLVETPAISDTSNKVALVIGNKNYQYAPLKNTINDANDVAAELKKMGFEVIKKTNLDYSSLDKAIYEFGLRLSGSNGVGLFYFSGHGARAGGKNYLLPTNNSQIRTSMNLKYNAVHTSKVLETMNNANTQISIIILDACRDNPYDKNIKRGLTRISSNRGSIIAFATAPGKTASDFSLNGRNGLFTAYLLAGLKNAHQTHQRVDDMFMDISNSVLQESLKRNEPQEPWYNSSLKRKFCFGGCQTPPPKPNPSVVLTKSPEMVKIPAGRFKMGEGKADEKPVHWVSVKQFFIGKFEVTNAEFVRFLNAEKRRGNKKEPWFETKAEDYDSHITGSVGKFQVEKGYENHPVIKVSWYGATAYAKWLSQQTGQTYRLPTEAEWEYAARAGKTTARYWGNNPNDACSYANVHDNTSKTENKFWWTQHNCTDGYAKTAPVGKFQSNNFGLFDMLGNVWEWTCSKYENQYNGQEQRCLGKNQTSISVVIRGSAWDSTQKKVQATSRKRYSRDNRYDNVGFRIARF